MYLKTKSRIGTKHRVGPGGSRCSCCAAPRKFNAEIRRTIRRIERREWQSEAGA